MAIVAESYTVNASSGCWEWTGQTDRDGYGRFEEDGSWVSAHRRSWEDAHGPIASGFEVDHRCENPVCVNPEHLQLLTHGENIRKSRQAKLTWPKVHAIRASEESARVLAERHGVSQQTIYEVRANNVWPEGDGKSRSRTKQLNIRFPPDLTEEMRSAAKERGVTLAEALRQGARMWLDGGASSLGEASENRGGPSLGNEDEAVSATGPAPASPRAEPFDRVVNERTGEELKVTMEGRAREKTAAIHPADRHRRFMCPRNCDPGWRPASQNVRCPNCRSQVVLEPV